MSINLRLHRRIDVVWFTFAASLQSSSSLRPLGPHSGIQISRVAPSQKPVNAFLGPSMSLVLAAQEPALDIRPVFRHQVSNNPADQARPDSAFHDSTGPAGGRVVSIRKGDAQHHSKQARGIESRFSRILPCDHNAAQRVSHSCAEPAGWPFPEIPRVPVRKASQNPIAEQLLGAQIGP